MLEVDKHTDVIAQAQKFAQESRYSKGLAILEQLGDALISNAEAVYVQAVCLRKLGKYAQALHALERVLTLDDKYVRAHQEMGHIFVAEGRLSPAIKAYETALQMDSALIASWRALVNLYTKAGSNKKLINAKNQVQQLQQLPPALQAVKSNLNRGNINTADQICRQYLQTNKTDVEAMRLLATIAVQAKIFDDAEFILESAVTFEPNHIGARYDYCNVLLRRQKFGKAHEIALQLLALDTNNIEFKTLLAATTTGVGDTEEGIKLYRELIASGKHMDRYYLMLGHAEKTRGELTKAVEAYQCLYQLVPDYGDAFWSLANTKTYTFTDGEIAHMRDYLERPETRTTDKVHFSFALGKALEDSKDFAGSFKAYERANSLNKELSKYQASHTVTRVDRHIKYCNSELYARLGNVGHDARDPVFIVGLPRSGSTLLEQILASHSQVDGTLELPNIPTLVRRLQGRHMNAQGEEPPYPPQYPKLLGEIDTSYFKKFGEQYIEDTRVFRQNAPFFIDKLPNNFLYIGLIKLILPNARIIDARRHPMACCFSGFKQFFAEGQEFTYGLSEIGDYYKNYIRLMDHWEEVLPGFVLRVQHEDVVNDLENQVYKILDFCGLSFEESCLEFYKTDRNVRTPSSEQVRQPIYKTGLQQWRNYEPYLDPLKEALGEQVLKRYPIE